MDSTQPALELLLDRRSTKAYSRQPLAASVVRRLLRSAVHRTPDRHPYGSAHARYPVAVTVVTGRVDELAPAAYLYDPVADELRCTRAGDHREALARLTLDAPWLADCPASLVLSADLVSADAHFADQAPERGSQFCQIEAGHIAQNIHLCCAAASIGTVFIGGLHPVTDPSPVASLVPDQHAILGLMPLGHPANPA